MATACARGHRLQFSRIHADERGCDVCGREITTLYAFHCKQCDYDLCGECHLPVEADLQAERAEVLSELNRLCLEQDSLVAAEEEEATSDDLALHDAKLLRVRLTAVLQRYQEKPPQLEDLVLRHEEELTRLAAEVHQLREENLTLALGASRSSGGGSSGSDARGESEEVCNLRRRRAESSKLRRQAQIMEFRLNALGQEMQTKAKQLHARERELAGLQKSYAEAADLARELETGANSTWEDVERERHVVQELNAQALSMREACYLPAELKKKSSILLKALDREGGRLSTEKKMRTLQSISKLYSAVAAQAPAVVPLAGRAKLAAEDEFARYQILEQAHARQLQRLQLVATRGVLGHPAVAGNGSPARSNVH